MGMLWGYLEAVARFDGRGTYLTGILRHDGSRWWDWMGYVGLKWVLE